MGAGRPMAIPDAPITPASLVQPQHHQLAGVGTGVSGEVRVLPAGPSFPAACPHGAGSPLCLLARLPGEQCCAPVGWHRAQHHRDGAVGPAVLRLLWGAVCPGQGVWWWHAGGPGKVVQPNWGMEGCSCRHIVGCQGMGGAQLHVGQGWRCELRGLVWGGSGCWGWHSMGWLWTCTCPGGAQLGAAIPWMGHVPSYRVAGAGGDRDRHWVPVHGGPSACLTHVCRSRACLQPPLPGPQMVAQKRCPVPPTLSTPSRLTGALAALPSGSTGSSWGTPSLAGGHPMPAHLWDTAPHRGPTPHWQGGEQGGCRVPEWREGRSTALLPARWSPAGQ